MSTRVALVSGQRTRPGKGWKLTYHKRRKLWALTFVAPFMGVFAVFRLLPYLMAVWLSLVNWKPLGSTRFVGLKNFAMVMHMEAFQKAVVNSLVYAALVVLPSLFISLLTAILIVSLREKKWQEFFQGAFYLPGVISGLAVAVIWRFIFSNNYGVLNYLLSLVGMGPVNWLGDTRIALYSLVLMALVGSHGGTIIIFCAALLGVPQDLYDAAAVDGAGFWRQQRHVTLPLITPAILYVLVVSTLGALQVFTPVYLLTRGGPVNSTMTIGYYIFQQLTYFGNTGTAAAAGLLLLVGTVGLTVLQFRSFPNVIEL